MQLINVVDAKPESKPSEDLNMNELELAKQGLANNPIALWTAVLAFATMLAVVVPAVTKLVDQIGENRVNRRMVVVMLRTIASRLLTFEQDLGSPAAQFYAGLDLLIGGTFSAEIARSMKPALAAQVYDAAMHGYGRLFGAEEWKRKGLFGPLQQNLHAAREQVVAALNEVESRG